MSMHSSAKRDGAPKWPRSRQHWPRSSAAFGTCSTTAGSGSAAQNRQPSSELQNAASNWQCLWTTSIHRLSVRCGCGDTAGLSLMIRTSCIESMSAISDKPLPIGHSSSLVGRDWSTGGRCGLSLPNRAWPSLRRPLRKRYIDGRLGIEHRSDRRAWLQVVRSTGRGRVSCRRRQGQPSS